MKAELAVAAFILALMFGSAPGIVIGAAALFAVVALIVWWP